jgi:hypothetical protein
MRNRRSPDRPIEVRELGSEIIDHLANPEWHNPLAKAITRMHDYRRRARCVPDRPVNGGNSRSLADSPMRRLTSEEAG